MRLHSESSAVYLTILINVLIWGGMAVAFNSLKTQDGKLSAALSDRLGGSDEDGSASEPTSNNPSTATGRIGEQAVNAALGPSQPSGRWIYGGSILRLESVGRVRRFHYFELPQDSPANGGDLIFEGVREGPLISGQAFQFSKTCAPAGYRVTGNISPDETTVRLSGKKPLLDAQCNLAGYIEDVLVFSLVDKL